MDEYHKFEKEKPVRLKLPLSRFENSNGVFTCFLKIKRLESDFRRRKVLKLILSRNLIEISIKLKLAQYKKKDVKQRHLTHKTKGGI